MNGPVQSWIMAHYHDYRDTAGGRADRITDCAEACQTSRHYASKAICGMEREGRISAAVPPAAPAPALAPATEGSPMPSTAPAAITEEALRARIDVHFMARQFLDSIPAGMFYGLDDAAAECGIARDTARAVFQDARYEAYRGQAVADRRTYLGHPDRIAAMKQERILR